MTLRSAEWEEGEGTGTRSSRGHSSLPLHGSGWTHRLAQQFPKSVTSRSSAKIFPHRPAAAHIATMNPALGAGHSSWQHCQSELLGPEVWAHWVRAGIDHSFQVSVKVNSSVWLKPGQRRAQVSFTWVGGSHESLHAEAGPVHLRPTWGQEGSTSEAQTTEGDTRKAGPPTAHREQKDKVCLRHA